MREVLGFSDDERERMLAESREKLRRDISARTNEVERRGLERGREEGLEEGLERGREEGREEAARLFAQKLLNLSPPEEIIVQATGLSKEVIQSLKNQTPVHDTLVSSQ